MRPHLDGFTNTGLGRFGRSPRRRGAAHRAVALLETLEDRTLLTTALSADIQRFGRDLGGLVQSAFETINIALFDDVLGNKLPLVGSSLQSVRDSAQNYFRTVGRDLTAQFQTLAESFDDEALSNAINNALGTKLVSMSSIPSQFDQGAIAHQIQFNLDFKGPLIDSSFSPDFDLGLPALGLSVQGKVNVALNYELKIGLGITDDGFYVDTQKADTELTLKLDVTTPGLVATGTLGFLQFTASDGTPKGDGTTQYSGFHGMFTVDMVNNDQQQQLFLKDFPTIPDTLALATTLSSFNDATYIAGGNAEVHLAMTLGFGSEAYFPTLGADFDLSWHFGNAPVNTANNTATFGDEPSVAFNNITLDVGSFFDRFLTPIVDEVQTALAPLQPAIDLLTTNIPVLSAIGFPTLLDLITKLDPGASTKFLTTVVAVDQLVNSIPTGLGSLPIPLGSFGLIENSIDARINGALATPLTHANVMDVSSEVASLSSSAAYFAALIKDNAKFGGGGGDDGKGLQIPLIQDPKLAFGILLGQNVNLFTFDMPTLRAGLTLDQFIPLLPPLGVSFRGTLDNAGTALQAVAHLAFGYDTAGFQDFAANHYDPSHLADLFNGFFVSSTDQPDGSGGHFVPQFSLNVGIGAFAAINLIVVQAGVGGGITGSVGFSLHDDNMDGKVRPKEIQDSLQFGPLYIFDVSAQMSASLSAYIKVGIEIPPFGFIGWSANFTIATTTLLDLHTSRATAPVLATLDANGVLTLNIAAGQTFTVDHYSGQAGQEVVSVSALGFTQLYGSKLAGGLGVKQIVASASSSDTINIGANVTSDAILSAGLDNNILHYFGSGNAVLSAQGSNNELAGGSGTNTFYGGLGGDRLIGGTGTNIFHASTNKPMGSVGDTMIAGPGNDTVYGGNGPDLFIAGTGSDTVYGGQGTTFSWAVGNGPLIINATPGTKNLLDVRGSTGNDTFVTDAGPGGGVIVNVNGVAISAIGIDFLSVAGGQGSDQITFHDLSDTSLQTIGVNTDRLTLNYGAVDTTVIDGPSSDTKLLVDVLTRPVAYDIHGNATSMATPMQVTLNNPNQQFLVANSTDNLIVKVGNGTNTVRIATTTTASRRLGQPYGNLVVNTGAGTNLINVSSTTGPTTVGGPGSNTFHIGSLAPASGGVLTGIRGALTLIGGGSGVMTVDNTGGAKAVAGTLTPTTLSGLGMGAGGIAYAGITNLSVSLGATPGSTFNAVTVSVDSSRNLPASTTITGGPTLRDSLTASFARDFNGTLGLFGFQTSTIKVGGNFTGLMTDTGPGAVQSITIGGSMTAASQLLAGSINSMTIGPANLSAAGYNLAGTVQVQGNLAQLSVAGNLSGRVIGRGNLVGSIRVGRDMSGLIASGGDLGKLSTSASGITSNEGSLQVNGTLSGQIVSLGNIFANLMIQGDLRGGRIAAKGRSIPNLDASRCGILGAITVGGTIDGASVIVSGGEIGDAGLKTGVSFAKMKGLIAAKGTVNLGIGGPPEGAIFQEVGNSGPNAAAIDAIFTERGHALGLDSSPDSGDLAGLALILKDLLALRVGTDGNLTGPVQ